MKIPRWVEAFRACSTRSELVRHAEEAVGSWIESRRRRIFFWNQLGAELVENPLTREFWVRQSALHQSQIMDQETWRRHCPRADHANVLIGPVVARGELIGAVAVTRLPEDPAFNDEDLARMNRFCLYFSTRLAELSREDPPLPDVLSAREREVCRAAARGLRNAQIAGELTISEHTVKQNLKSIYRKLKVKSRTEMARMIAR